MVSTSPQTSDRVLLVEGPDDEHVVHHICIRNSLPLSFKVIQKDGWANLRESISVEIKAPGRQVVGILADADDDPAGRWNSIKHQLGQAGINVEGPSFPQGLIVDGVPKIGAWVMPDNKSLGELEDFVIEMIPDGDKIWPLSKSYMDGIPKVDRPFTEGKRPRAQLYAWLATREEPRLMGAAIGTHDLNTDGPLCQRFADWLKQLFQ